MEKLELKNGEQIEIKDGASIGAIRIEVPDMDAFKELRGKFTDDNLSVVSFYNGYSSIPYSVYEDKTLLKDYPIEEICDDDGNLINVIVTFSLKDIDLTKKELNSLRETVNTLVLASLEVE